MLDLFVNVPRHRLRKIRSLYVDPKYSADHGPLPHISAGHEIQRSATQLSGCMCKQSDSLTPQ